MNSPTILRYFAPFAHYFYIALGGAAGALLRTLVCFLIIDQILAVLVCNVFGTFLLAAITLSGRIWKELKSSIAVGFCGGLSVFASFSKDSVFALKSRDYVLFFSNFAGNFLLCVLMVYAAFWIAEKLKKNFTTTSSAHSFSKIPAPTLASSKTPQTCVPPAKTKKENLQ